MTLPEALTVEVEFQPGVWTDLSTRVLGEVQVRGGRSTAYEDTAPSTLALILNNADGALTPDNPLSTYYPYITENIGIRVTLTDGNSDDRDLFEGFIDAFQPQWPSGHYSSAIVQIDASDVLARVNRLVLRSDWVEQCLLRTSTYGDTWVDVWPVAGDSHAARLGNVGDGTGTRYPAELRRQKVTPWGTYSLGDTVPTSEARLDGCLTLDPAAPDAAAYRRGWTARYRTSQAPGTIQFWFSIPPDAALVNSNGTPWTSMLIGSLLDASGNMLVNIGVTADGSGLTVGPPYLVADGPIDFLTGGDANLRDGGWHLITIVSGSGTASWRVDDSSLDVASTDDFLVDTRTLVLGGGFSGNGAQAAVGCVPMRIGPVAFLEDTGEPLSNYGSGDPMQQRTVADRAGDIAYYVRGHGLASGLGSYAGSQPQYVLGSASSGRTAGDVAQELARTIGGAYWCDLDGDLHLLDGTGLRVATPAATITIEEDDAGAFEWRRAVDERPTRVTANSVGGGATVIDADAEALGARRDEAIDTCALNSAGSAAAAGWRLSMAEGLRLRKVAVDLVTATNDLWALLGDLAPFVRLRVAGLPSTQLGYTYVDVHVVGWTITVSPERVLLEMDTVPAAVEAAMDDARVSAGASTLDATITSSATTLAIATSAGATWTTDAGSYPMTAVIGGEGITLTSAPGGSTSPQTFTSVTRGVNGTVARAHTAGESCDVWDALTINI